MLTRIPNPLLCVPGVDVYFVDIEQLSDDSKVRAECSPSFPLPIGGSLAHGNRVLERPPGAGTGAQRSWSAWYGGNREATAKQKLTYQITQITGIALRSPWQFSRAVLDADDTVCQGPITSQGVRGNQSCENQQSKE